LADITNKPNQEKHNKRWRYFSFCSTSKNKVQ